MAVHTAHKQKEVAPTEGEETEAEKNNRLANRQTLVFGHIIWRAHKGSGDTGGSFKIGQAANMKIARTSKTRVHPTDRVFG